MNLRQLLGVVGVLAVGGVTYRVLAPRPGVTVGDLRAASIFAECPPQLLTCAVRQTSAACYPAQRRYRTLETAAFVCSTDGGLGGLLFRWPRQGGQDCVEVAGDPSEACTLAPCNGDPLCADDGGTSFDFRAAQDRCACRPSDGGVCRYQLPDGGTPLMKFGLEYQAPFAGAGCVRKACGEMDGDQGLSMPPECQ